MLGPLLLCLTVQPLLMSMQSEVVLGFIDDFTIGGYRATVASDVLTVVNKGKEFGFSLNFDKREVTAKKGDKMSGVMNSSKPRCLCRTVCWPDNGRLHC